MPEKINFTMAALAKLDPPEAGRRTVYDTKSPGLCLMITAAGAKSFYVYKKVDGRPERIRIGGFPEITVDTARDEATKISADIASGVNPAESKRKRRGELTMGQLFELYLEFHAVPHKKASSVATDRATWKRYMSSWEGRKLSSVDDNAIRALHGKIGKANGKYAANRLLALLSRMFTEAIKHREWKLANPCRGVTLFDEKSRDRFLQPEEIPRFLAAVDALENQQIADAFRLMLFTGARKGNVLAMRWEELNLTTGTWRVPDTKANEPQLVHLPEMAVTILTKLKAADSAKPEHKQSPFVFPARTAGAKAGCLQDVTKSWEDVREAAGLPGLRMHDLRRSLGSWMAGSGASLIVIGKTLGHHDSATTAIYSRLNIDPVRAAVDTAVAAMVAAGKQTEEKAGE
jgi:integrase